MPSKHQAWRDYVRTCLDTLIEHGRDRYGPVSSPLFMAVLDADLLVSPRKPLPLDALVRLEYRLHRRAERGSNLWYDHGLLRALYRMTQLTGDKRYAAAADDYIRYFFDHCHKLTEGDKGYRADWIDAYLLDLGIEPVIPSKENEDRAARPVEFDKQAYRRRNIVERLIGWLKESRRIFSRFEKTAKNFGGMLTLAFIRQYLQYELV